MGLGYIETSDGTKIPTLSRTDGADAVEVPESVASFDDGSLAPVRVSPSSPLPVAGKSVRVAVSFTRPSANSGSNIVFTNGAPMNFANFARVNGGGGYIVGARLAMQNLFANVYTFRVHLWNAVPTLAANGQSWKELYADESKRIAVFNLTTWIMPADVTSDVAFVEDMTLRIPFVADPASRSLYAALEMLTYADAGATSETVTLTLLGELN